MTRACGPQSLPLAGLPLETSWPGGAWYHPKGLPPGRPWFQIQACLPAQCSLCGLGVRHPGGAGIQSPSLPQVRPGSRNQRGPAGLALHGRRLRPPSRPGGAGLSPPRLHAESSWVRCPLSRSESGWFQAGLPPLAQVPEPPRHSAGAAKRTIHIMYDRNGIPEQTTI